MALIEFEDLPSTNTPINATNLNNNFDEVKNSNTYGTSQSQGYSQEYVNGIIESDSDATGNTYIKFIDGTMICTGYGNITFSGQNYASFEALYLAEFTTYPVVAVTSIGGDPTYAFKFTMNYNKTKVSGIAKSDTTLSSVSRPYSYIAIGRWK